MSLSASAQPPAPFSFFRGKVIDKFSKKPIPDLIVSIQGAKNFTTETNADGIFKLKIPNIPSTLVIEAMDYAKFSLEITKPMAPGEIMDIELFSKLKVSIPKIEDGMIQPALFGKWKTVWLKGPGQKIKTKKNAQLRGMGMVVKTIENNGNQSKGMIGLHNGCNKSFATYMRILNEKEIGFIKGLNMEFPPSVCEQIESEVSFFKTFENSLNEKCTYKINGSTTKLKITSGLYSMLLLKDNSTL